MTQTTTGRGDFEKEFIMLECMEKALQGRGYLTCALNEARSLALWREEEENLRQEK